MVEYIRLDEAIETIRSNGVYGEGHSDEEREDDVINMLESISLVDVKEVVHAHWESCVGDNHSQSSVGVFCSKCKSRDNAVNSMKYCPNCGATMDERK